MDEEKKNIFAKIIDSLTRKDEKEEEQAVAVSEAREVAAGRAAEAQAAAEGRAAERAAAERAEAARREEEKMEMQRAAEQARIEREEAEARRLAARLGQQERVESERQEEGRTKIGQAAAEELANRDATREGPGAQPAERKPALTPAEMEEPQPLPPDERPENLPEGELGESIFPRRTARGTVQARSLHVRSDHATDAESIAGLVAGQEVTVYDTWTNGTDTWVRIGDGQWAAAHYHGETYIQIDEN